MDVKEVVPDQMLFVNKCSVGVVPEGMQRLLLMCHRIT
jgi:hypothetical protein